MVKKRREFEIRFDISYERRQLPLGKAVMGWSYVDPLVDFRWVFWNELGETDETSFELVRVEGEDGNRITCINGRQEHERVLDV
ncbi:hypothetical protein EVAR_103444_1 [Eumeta japonica]|uniref:Uncharacterized protein n=1 Tax=Eumeta variegata TaxID=151549 RepID=A0A4C1Z0K1_EUMVA|nr:hypothetical protein EVAR_103444_1 [Eumeta japonica]